MKKTKTIREMVLPVLLGTIVFTMLLQAMYLYDNKYTKQGLQPVAGTIVVSEENLSHHFVYYLTREWQFYPDVLLTPSDFLDGKTPNTYMQTIAIGQHSVFPYLSQNETTGGSASYRLSIVLPAKMHRYTLVLPEIYSAYELFVNGEKQISVGVPSSDGFTERITKKSITISVQNRLELLITVSNRSHFSDGMTFPPIFGLTEAVQRQENLQLLIHGVSFFLSLLFTFFSLLLVIVTRNRNPKQQVIIFFASLCITISFFYPILFTFFNISPLLWFGIELVGIYGTYFFAVLLQNEICQVSLRLQQFSNIVLGSFCLLALFFGIFPIYRVWMVNGFSILTTAIKLFMIVYLFYTSILTSIKKGKYDSFLLFCTTGFAISLGFDRSYTNWEPILFGWPQEYGNALLILGFSVVIWKDIFTSYRYRLTFEEEKRQLTRQIKMQKVHYLELTDKIAETIRIRHDERHHLQTLCSIYEKHDYERLGSYLAQYVLTAMPKERTILCNNLVVDSILSYYQGLCQTHLISFECVADLPNDLPVSDTSISILFGNLLENALEAAKNCTTPFLRIKTRWDSCTFYLLVENSFSGELHKRGERFVSTKHSGFGIGTESVNALVKSYHGTCIFDAVGQVFHASILFMVK